ncbi:cupin domain-containing protein [Jiangella mangrovi]|uniref:Gentisate 1,2-dioxygenase n=1 Tax=Jiangella mangrovi TaxID=1524084 RepID=A0A7W9LK97_9ACTN|nr:gentisate 1,2-dioxygenase [Jiangella mangrovi]
MSSRLDGRFSGAEDYSEGATHYDVQNKRRASVVEEARKRRTAVVREADVVIEDSPLRRMRRGVYMGADGVRPTDVMATDLHEIPAGATSTIHRHSWDAVMWVTAGTGWTEINGVRVDWKPWDTVYIPAWSWHRHGNESAKDARYMSWSVGPMFEYFGLALLEDAGDEPFAQLPPPPKSAASNLLGDRLDPADPYARRLTRLLNSRVDTSDSRLHTAWDDVTPRVTKRGARSMFLVDESIGYRTSGLTAVMHELAPGRWQARHRHGGDAYLYVVKGHGHSDIDEDSYTWAEGDLIVVDHWCWHQHFNDDPEATTRLIRVHNADSIFDLMSTLLDPLPLLEEPPQLDGPDLTGFVWPDPLDGRPPTD